MNSSSSDSTYIQVIVRARPPNQNENGDSCDRVIFAEDDKSVSILQEGKDLKSFTLDRIFPPSASQQELFETVKDYGKHILNGYNCTIIAYGQTGSGKTYTMSGKNGQDTIKSQEGVIPRIIDDLFSQMNEASSPTEFSLGVRFVEIYMERIRDLLDETATNLKIHVSKSRGIFLDGRSTYISSKDDFYGVWNTGTQNRRVGQTKMNNDSSRSHSILIVEVTQTDVNTGSSKMSKLTLVDLAGSEQVGRTGAEGMTLKEAQYINKSLSGLGNVISSLCQKKTHIPYRDSKLTHLLSDSFGGNTRTCIIATVSPANVNIMESLSTLRFVNSAKEIKNAPVVNKQLTMQELMNVMKTEAVKVSEMLTTVMTVIQASGMSSSVIPIVDDYVTSSLLFTLTGVKMKTITQIESSPDDDDDDDDSFNPYTADVDSLLALCSDFLGTGASDQKERISVFTLSELLVRCEELQTEKEACECRVEELENELDALQREEYDIQTSGSSQFVKKVVVSHKN